MGEPRGFADLADGEALKGGPDFTVVGLYGPRGFFRRRDPCKFFTFAVAERLCLLGPRLLGFGRVLTFLPEGCKLLDSRFSGMSGELTVREGPALCAKLAPTIL